MKVIFVTRDGVRRKIKQKLAEHLCKAGKGYIEGNPPFVASTAITPVAKNPIDLFAEKPEEKQDSTDNLEDDKEPEKHDNTPRRGRPSRAQQEYKTRMMQSEQTTDTDQAYSAKELNAE